MPRKIPSDIVDLLENKDWLYDKHVANLFSISFLSETLGVTEGVIRKALRKHNIISPSQQQLREATNLRKYGVINQGQREEVQKLAKDTMTLRYGGHNFSHIGDRNVRDKTMLEKYGDSNAGKIEIFINKAKTTNNRKYGRDHIKQQHISTEALAVLNDKDWLIEQHINLKKTLTQIAEEVGVDMTTVMNRMRAVGIDTHHFFQSYEENQLFDYVMSLVPQDTPFLRNVRSIIAPYELDIVFPTLNVAIEYCGLYYHTTAAGKTRSYHKTKWQMCNDLGIRLITIFSDEWLHKRKIVEAKLANILQCYKQEKIFARKCNVVTITNSQATDFLNDHHIQGSKAGTICYGLLHGQELISVCVFKLYANTDTWYLERYASSKMVVGGFSKILNYFIKNNEWTRITTFADLRWSQGDLYMKTGFQLEEVTPPDYEYVISNKRFHKFNFRHSRLAKLLPSYDPLISETANMENAGYHRIYNCGLMKFIKRKP